MHDVNDEYQPNAGLKFIPYNNIKICKCLICGKLYDDLITSNGTWNTIRSKRMCFVLSTMRCRTLLSITIEETHDCSCIEATCWHVMFATKHSNELNNTIHRTIHRRKHTKRMPYHCPICNIDFMVPACITSMLC